MKRKTISNITDELYRQGFIADYDEEVAMRIISIVTSEIEKDENN